MPELITGANGRLFITEDTASPSRAPVYFDKARAGAISFGQGSLTAIRQPSPDQYGQFETVGTLRGAADLPSWTIEARMVEQASEWLRLANKGCAIDVHLHVGRCQNPRSFNGGFTFARILEDAQISSYDTSDMMVFDESSDAVVTENIPLSGRRIYDVKQIRPTEQAGAEATDEIVGIAVADAVSCGSCGAPSDGCSVVLAVAAGVAGSPGLPTEVLYTQDGGATWASTSIDSMGLAETPTAIASIGDYVVVTSNDAGAIFTALLADVLAGTDVWTKVTSGLNVSGPPNAITSTSPVTSWIAGDGGYLYFSADPSAGVTEQADGTLTAQDLADIHALDDDNVLAVGAANAVLVTANGGTTWSLVVGPAPAINLTAAWMRTDLEWLVGTAGGELYYTTNGGTTWTAIAFSGSGGGTVHDIVFATKNVGYMAHATAAAAGRIFRTLDGGRSWYLLPEETGVTFPANDRVNALAACGYAEPNAVYGGGLGDDASDGFIVKVA